MKKGNKKKRVENRKLRDASRISGNNEMLKLGQIIGIILVFLVVFVGVVYIIDKVAKKKPEDQTETTIQYSQILAGNILKQIPDEYYVLAAYEEDGYIPLYVDNLNKYVGTDTKLHYYTVDLANTFNKWSIGEANVLNITNITDIRFKETVLLKIKNKKIDKTFAGFENIKNHLFEITKTES